MGKYIFEPGHTEAGFRARHMMVSWVNGMFKDVHGEINFDLEDPVGASFTGVIDATKLWSGEPDRDAHLRSADFFDVDEYPQIEFSGLVTERVGVAQFRGETELTIRGTTRTVPLEIRYLGQWVTPFWEGDENKGDMRRIGFEAHTRINRHDFGVSWQGELPGGGVVVSSEIGIALGLEAIHEGDLEKTGAIAFYRGDGN